MNVFHLSILIAAVLLIISGLYLLMRTHNMIKIIIGVELMMKAVTLVLAFAGYFTGNYGLVQAFIITMIVVEVIIAVVAAGIIISYFRNNGNINLRNLNKLKG